MLPSNWPRWIIIPIGFVLAVASIGIGLILEPAVQSLADHPEPTPTLPCLEYAAPLSGECIGCHTDAERMETLVMTEEDKQRLTIDPTQINTVHGELGCVTCHGGTAGTADVDASHVGLVQDPSVRYERTCLLCHRDLKDSNVRYQLHPPHQAVLDSPEGVECSACHGAVGHGFNAPSGEPVCSMAACLDCHEEQDLDVQSQDCDSCHVAPHDVAAALTCSDCHASIQTWSETRLSSHPISLTGRHAEAECFQCHDWPNFRSLDYVCSDCHDRPHEDFGGDDCQDCHSPEGWGVDAPEGHTFPTDHGGADTSCSDCHPGGDTSETYCFSCHSSTSTVDVHRAQGVIDIFGKCADCHPEG